jgi:hypothetical protein
VIEWLKVAKKESAIRWDGQDELSDDMRVVAHRLMYEAGRMFKGICLGSPKRLAKFAEDGVFQELFDLLVGEMRSKKPLVSGMKREILIFPLSIML